MTFVIGWASNSKHRAPTTIQMCTPYTIEKNLHLEGPTEHTENSATCQIFFF